MCLRLIYGFFFFSLLGAFICKKDLVKEISLLYKVFFILVYIFFAVLTVNPRGI